jgi:hypothetical protein
LGSLALSGIGGYQSCALAKIDLDQNWAWPKLGYGLTENFFSENCITEKVTLSY